MNKPQIHNIKTALTAFVLLNLFGHTIQSKAEEARVLPGITVFATKNADNTVTQRSASVWEESKDPTIKKERNGSYTVSDNTKSQSLKKLIISLGNPTVNIDFSYARNSVSMTADGRLALTTLVESLGQLDEGTTIRLTPINRPDQAGKNIVQRRAESLYTILQQNHSINVKLTQSKTRNVPSSKSTSSDIWRIQVQQEI